MTATVAAQAQSSYLFAVTCGHCGAPVRRVTGAKTGGSQTVAVAECSDASCGAEWVLSVFMRHNPKPESVRRQKYRQQQ